MKRLIFFLLVSTTCQVVTAEEATIKKPFFDFFRKLIEPPKRKLKKKKQRVLKSSKKETVVIPPLQMSVMGISGEEGNRVAIVTFEGKQRLLMDGDEEAGKFRVISIEPTKITLMHFKAGRRQEISFK